MKAYKGFTKDMKCRDFQFSEGETYHEDKAELCEKGFHACEDPIDCFSYYNPSESVYHEVELDEVSDERNDDSKVVAKTIKIGGEVSFLGIAKAHVDYIISRVKDDKKKSAHKTEDRSAATNTGNRSAATNTGNMSAATNTGDMSAATNTGNWSAATNTGDMSAATNTGNRSAATNTGNRSAATNTGNRSAATNTGDRSAATNTGNWSAATNTGDMSAATNTGNMSAATNTGDWSAATNTGDWSAATVTGKDSVAIVTGLGCKVKGAIGCAIVCVERGEWSGETYPIKAICSSIVDGEKIKADTWYTVKNGEFVEVEE